jgi:hypothetical protein
MKDTVPVLDITAKRGSQAAPIRGVSSSRSWTEQISVLVISHDAVGFCSGGIRFECRPSYHLIKVSSMPLTVAARSEVWTVFARSNTVVVGSNTTWGMDVCVRLFCVCVVLCVGSGFATGWSPVQGVLPTVYRIKKLKKRQKARQRAVESYVM